MHLSLYQNDQINSFVTMQIYISMPKEGWYGSYTDKCATKEMLLLGKNHVSNILLYVNLPCINAEHFTHIVLYNSSTIHWLAPDVSDDMQIFMCVPLWGGAFVIVRSLKHLVQNMGTYNSNWQCKQNPSCRRAVSTVYGGCTFSRTDTLLTVS